MKRYRQWSTLMIVVLLSVFISGCTSPEATTPDDADPVNDGESEVIATDPAAEDDADDSTAIEDIPASLQDEGRYLRVIEISGEVSISQGEDANPRDVLIGELLPAGSILVTGEDGEVILELDDGTLIVISAELSVTLSDLEGTTLTPITRFFMNIGEIFAFREDSPPLGGDAAFDIETPQGMATIRGSSLNVRFRVIDPDRPEIGEMVAICLSGDCSAQGTADELEITLEGGNQSMIDLDGKASAAEAAPVEDLERGQETLSRAEQATGKTEQIALCHATGDPAHPYVELHVSYNITDGHGHEDHEGDLIPIPEEGCPQPEIPEVTPTPTATPEPTAIPVFESGLCEPTQQYTVGSGPEAPEGYEFANMYGNAEGISADTPLFLFVGGWLANGADCAAQNSEHITMTFSIDGQDIPLTQGGLYNCSEAGQGAYCVFWYALIDELSAGTHSGVEIVSSDATFSSGFDDDGDGELDQIDPGQLWEQSYEFTVGSTTPPPDDGGDAGGYGAYIHLGGMTYGTCGGSETVSAGLVYIEVGAGCGDDYDHCVTSLSGTVPVITANDETVPLWANGTTPDGIPLDANGVSAVDQFFGSWGKTAMGTITLEPGTYTVVYSWPTADGTPSTNYCTLTVVEP